MTRKQRLRRVGILCCHCLRNLAFFRAGWRKNEPRFRGDFWNNLNSNFLDICVLEWYNLFADNSGKHHWEKVICNHQSFRNDLLRAIKLSETEFDNYIKEMKAYRDHFVAHLDEKRTMHIPKLGTALRSVSFLYCHLLNDEDHEECFFDAPHNALSLYKRFVKEGKQEYLKYFSSPCNTTP